jgi:hypothetical protein
MPLDFVRGEPLVKRWISGCVDRVDLGIGGGLPFSGATELQLHVVDRRRVREGFSDGGVLQLTRVDARDRREPVWIDAIDNE